MSPETPATSSRRARRCKVDKEEGTTDTAVDKSTSSSRKKRVTIADKEAKTEEGGGGVGGDGNDDGVAAHTRSHDGGGGGVEEDEFSPLATRAARKKREGVMSGGSVGSAKMTTKKKASTAKKTPSKNDDGEFVSPLATRSARKKRDHGSSKKTKTAKGSKEKEEEQNDDVPPPPPPPPPPLPSSEAIPGGVDEFSPLATRSARKKKKGKKDQKDSSSAAQEVAAVDVRKFTPPTPTTDPRSSPKKKTKEEEDDRKMNAGEGTKAPTEAAESGERSNEKVASNNKEGGGDGVDGAGLKSPPQKKRKKKRSKRKAKNDRIGAKEDEQKEEERIGGLSTNEVKNDKEKGEEEVDDGAAKKLSPPREKTTNKKARSKLRKREKKKTDEVDASDKDEGKEKGEDKKEKEKAGGICAAAPAASITPSPLAPPHPQRSQPKLIDVTVQRLRYLHMIPRGILTLASTPLENENDEGLMTSSSSSHLALAREGGAVELLNTNEKWRVVATVPGLRKREVDCLAWVCGRQGYTGDDGEEEEGGGTEANNMDVVDNDYNEKVKVPKTSHSCEEHARARAVHERRRLFGASRDGTIFEIDFARQRHSHVTGSGGGGVFALASLCPRCRCENGGTGCSGYVAAGCEDGSVRLHRARGSSSSGGGGDGSTLELIATLPSAGQAVLSLAWAPGCGGSLEGSVIYAGIADGTIRRFDCVGSSGKKTSALSMQKWRATLRMTVENLGRRDPTRVWALQVLADGWTVVSGDSLGNVQFWDGQSGTLTCTFRQNENRADVLALAVSQDGCRVFASGVDSRVVCIERQQPHTLGGKSGVHDDLKWVLTNAQRPHTHDVKGLAVCIMTDNTGAGGAARGRGRELIVSGGTDTKLCTYMATDFRRYRAKKWYNWPSVSPISLSRGRRVVSLLRSDCVDLYQLGKASSNNRDALPEVIDEESSHIGTINIDSIHNLFCSAISDDGNFLAVSDAASLLLFSLRYVDDGSDGTGRRVVIPTKIKLPRFGRLSCAAVKFDGSGRLFCATTAGPICVLRIDHKAVGVREMDLDGDAASHLVTVEHTFTEHNLEEGRNYPVINIDISPDGRWLASSRNALGSGAIHVFALPQTTSDAARCESGYRHWWSIPAMEAPHSCIKFLGGGKFDSALAAGCSNNSFYIFDLERKCLSDWSQDAGFPISSSLPRELTHRAEPAVRLAFNPATPNKFLMGGHGFFCVIDLDHPVPDRSNIFPSNHIREGRFVPKNHRPDSARAVASNGSDTMEGLPISRKRKRTMSNTDMEYSRRSNFTICLRYGGMLFLDFVAENEMVVVEQPWMSVVNALPDALERRVYGGH